METFGVVKFLFIFGVVVVVDAKAIERILSKDTKDATIGVAKRAGGMIYSKGENAFIGEKLYQPYKLSQKPNM